MKKLDFGHFKTKHFVMKTPKPWCFPSVSGSFCENTPVGQWPLLAVWLGPGPAEFAGSAREDSHSDVFLVFFCLMIKSFEANP